MNAKTMALFAAGALLCTTIAPAGKAEAAHEFGGRSESAQPLSRDLPQSDTSLGPASWERVPTADDLALLYPERALRLGRGGAGILACVATAEGLLQDCKVLFEGPSDSGFGEATLRAAAKFKLAPTTTSGEPITGATVPVIMRWRPPR